MGGLLFLTLTLVVVWCVFYIFFREFDTTSALMMNYAVARYLFLSRLVRFLMNIDDDLEVEHFARVLGFWLCSGGAVYALCWAWDALFRA